MELIGERRGAFRGGRTVRHPWRGRPFARTPPRAEARHARGVAARRAWRGRSTTVASSRRRTGTGRGRTATATSRRRTAETAATFRWCIEGRPSGPSSPPSSTRRARSAWPAPTESAGAGRNRSFRIANLRKVDCIVRNAAAGQRPSRTAVSRPRPCRRRGCGEQRTVRPSSAALPNRTVSALQTAMGWAGRS